RRCCGVRRLSSGSASILTDGSSPSRALRTTSILFAVVLAVALLYFSLRGIEWRRVGHLISHASPGWIALALALTTMTLFLRACRWRVLLSAEADVTVPD